MDERRITVGQRSAGPGEQPGYAALALAALDDADVVVVADGGEGVPPTQAAGDAAARAIVRVSRSVRHLAPVERLRFAMEEAHRAILELSRESAAARGVAAGCVAAFVEESEANVALVGRAAAFLVHQGIGSRLFDSTSDAIEATPLGIGTEPPSAHVEKLAFSEGDRLVLTTASVARHVDAATVARVVWTMEPQVAATRLAELARRAGGPSPAVQVVRRESSSLADALDLIRPDRQRELSRERGSAHRARERLRSTRWAQLVVGLFVAAIVTVGLYVGLATRSDTPSAPAPEARGAASDAVTRDASEPDARSQELAESPTSRPDTTSRTLRDSPGVDAGGRTAPQPERDAGKRREEAMHDGATVTAPDSSPASAEGEGDPVHPAPIASTLSAEEVQLRAIFARSPKKGARLLKRYILRRYDDVGAKVFDELDAYLRQHGDRAAVEILVELLERRPPPLTRAWLRSALPKLLAPDDASPWSPRP